jgi:hypothetical protein
VLVILTTSSSSVALQFLLHLACTSHSIQDACPLQELTYTPATASTSRAERSQGTVAAGLAVDAYADIIAAAAAAAASPADEQAAAAASNCHLFFSMPPVPVAGAAATLYVNRARLQCGLGEAPNVKLSIGFNDWQVGHQTVGGRVVLPGHWYHFVLTWFAASSATQQLECLQKHLTGSIVVLALSSEHQAQHRMCPVSTVGSTHNFLSRYLLCSSIRLTCFGAAAAAAAAVLQVDLKPTSLWRGEGLDWWCAGVAVPGDAVLANLCFSAEWNGAHVWDNNDGEHVVAMSTLLVAQLLVLSMPSSLILDEHTAVAALLSSCTAVRSAVITSRKPQPSQSTQSGHTVTR